MSDGSLLKFYYRLFKDLAQSQSCWYRNRNTSPSSNVKFVSKGIVVSPATVFSMMSEEKENNCQTRKSRHF